MMLFFGKIFLRSFWLRIRKYFAFLKYDQRIYFIKTLEETLLLLFDAIQVEGGCSSVDFLEYFSFLADKGERNFDIVAAREKISSTSVPFSLSCLTFSCLTHLSSEYLNKKLIEEVLVASSV